jgi:signal transduction histidine kinase
MPIRGTGIDNCWETGMKSLFELFRSGSYLQFKWLTAVFLLITTSVACLGEERNDERTQIEVRDELPSEIDIYRQQFYELDAENRQFFYRGFILFLFLTGAGTLGFVWYNRKQSQKNMHALADLSKEVLSKNMELEKKHEEMSRIMSALAHDLRNSIGGIQALTSLMVNETNLTEEQRHWVRLMNSSSVQAMELICNIMDTEYSVQIPGTIEKQPHDIRMIVNNCVDMLEYKANEKKQTIHVNIEEGMMVPVNRSGIVRVICNVIGNAIKFSPVNASIFVELKMNKTFALLSIRDQGIGIPGELKEYIFDMFTDAKRKGTSGEQSFGLGLSIAKRIVDSHNGEIWFKTKEHEGTTFFIKLPMIAEEHSM